MNEAQVAFLFRIAERIPRLLAALQNGNQRAEFVIGKRVIAGRQVRLVLLAEVVDPGDNPLATHSAKSGAAPRATTGSATNRPAGSKPPSRR